MSTAISVAVETCGNAGDILIRCEGKGGRRGRERGTSERLPLRERNAQILEEEKRREVDLKF